MASLAPGGVGGEGDEVAGGVGEAFGVGVAVLHDQAGDPFGVAFGDAEADGRPEVEDVHHEPVQAEVPDESLGDVGEVVERVGEVVRALGVTEAGVVGGDQPVVRAEDVDEAAELMGAGREPVQEQQYGRVSAVREGLPVEDPDAVHLQVAVDSTGDWSEHA